MDAPNGSGPATPRQGTGAGSESSHPKGTAVRRRAQAGRARPVSRRNGATLQRSRRKDAKTPEQRQAAAWEACKDLAHQPRIFDCLVRDLEKLGLVGEVRAAKLIYLVLTSRVLDRPLCAVVKGPSSAGKSFLIEQVLEFFPPSAVDRLTGMPCPRLDAWFKNRHFQACLRLYVSVSSSCDPLRARIL